MNAFLQAACQGLEPEPDITVTQWADGKRILPAVGSNEAGPYDSTRTPYMIEIMDVLSVSHPCNDVTFVKGTQLGATEGGTNFIGYIIDVAPGPVMLVLPTDDLADGHSVASITPSIEETPSLKEKVAALKSRSSSNTIRRKSFPGGILFIQGANSPIKFRQKSIRYLILDDYDGMPFVAGQEGDTGDLAARRTDTYGIRKKIYRNSTPTIKGLSRIWAAWEESDQRHFNLPCPFCGHKQPLEWGSKNARKGIKFKRSKMGEVVAVWYECRKCHKGIDESYKTEMLEAGVWVPRYKRREKRGYHLSSLYSPLGWVSWLQIVEEFLAAKDSPERLKVWTNTRLAEVWDEKGSQPDWTILRDRADIYHVKTAPDPVCFLSAGVDVQKDWFEIVVRGWGPGEESWLAYHEQLFCDTSQPESFNLLDGIFSIPFRHEQGVDLYVDQMAIDSGYRTHEVYNYCRKKKLKTMATKGSAIIEKPLMNQPNSVDVNHEGEKIKNGCQLWIIGTDKGKTQIYNRLSMEKPGPGYYHFPAGLTDEYYLGLTAEKKVDHYVNGFPKPVWMKLRERNEPLDCELLALVAAYRAGMAFVNWDKLRIKKIMMAKDPQPKPKRKRRKPKTRPKKW